jgi:hypothetical protein
VVRRLRVVIGAQIRSHIFHLMASCHVFRVPHTVFLSFLASEALFRFHASTSSAFTAFKLYYADILLIFVKRLCSSQAREAYYLKMLQCVKVF